MTTPTMNSVAAERVSLPEDAYISSLIGGTRWVASGGSVALTYSFPISADNWASPYSTTNEPASGVLPLGTAATSAAHLALEQWARYANISFTLTSDTQGNVGDIRLAQSVMGNDEFAAYAYLPTNRPLGGDIWFDGTDSFRSFSPGSYGFFTMLHEIGHALGFKHPFDDTPDNDARLDPGLDSVNLTVMSYNLYPDKPGSDFGLSFMPTTLMELDIAALQYLYGVKAYNPGDTQYVFNQGSRYFETIYDSGGTDTIVWNATTQGTLIDLEGGYWSELGEPLLTVDLQGNIVKVDPLTVAIYSQTVIENAVAGDGDDVIFGNDVANSLVGGAGHDDILGYAGNDTLIGGSGNDHLYGRTPSGGADGEDSLSGGDGSDYLQGNAGNDLLDGGDGSDRINGGGNDDTILGGAGNDTVNGNLGADTISGGDGNDSLRGGQGADSISGGAGNDIVSGDLGADMLSGGDGADLFVVNGAGSTLAQPDRILDFAIGTDRIAIGFAPGAILLSSAQANAGLAVTAAQQLFDGRAGDGEVAALMVGGDTYLFYAANGGGTVDAAIVLTGANALSIGLADFG